MKFHVNVCAMLDFAAQFLGERSPNNQRLLGRLICTRVRWAIGKRPAQPPTRDRARRFEVFLASHDVNSREPAEGYLPQERRRQIRQLIRRIQRELSRLGIVEYRSSDNREFTLEKQFKRLLDCNFPLTSNVINIWVSKRDCRVSLIIRAEILIR